jgi:dTMP kinase
MTAKLFIVLEGIDGSGTTTQATLLQEYFHARGEKAVISPEPTDGAIGRLLREALQKEILPFRDRERFDEQMAYLFAADRYYHLYNDRDGIFTLTRQQETHVISTRYYFSSLAYNCNTPEEYEFVSRLNQRFPDPDITIYLDISPEISLKRIQNRSVSEIYEKQEKLEKVRENFRNIFQTYRGEYLSIDATKDITDIHRIIIESLDKSVRGEE